MFKNLKEKVKKDSSVLVPTVRTPVFPNRSKSTNNDDTKSNASSRLTDDQQTNSIQSSSEENNSKLVTDVQIQEIIQTNESELIQRPVEVKSPRETRELNGNLAEIIKLQKFNETLLSRIEALNDDIRLKETQLDRFKFENQSLLDNLGDYKEMLSNYEINIKNIQDEKNELIIKNAELSQKYEFLKMVNQKQESNLIMQSSQQVSTVHSSSLDSELTSTENGVREMSATDESENIVENKYLEENKSLRADLNEKNKMIKNLQQRLNDMKKALQKELNSQSHLSLPNEKKPLVEVNLAHSQSTYSLKSTYSPSLTKPNTSLLFSNGSEKGKPNESLSSLHDDLNFKYLKHVVLKFLCSREYEAMHLIRALSVLLNLSKEEEKVLKETLEWKMSWFGTRPKILA